ncbi:MAG: hypothetical protein WA369_12070 [Candidatus Acidiferrales bacterium]
MSVKFTNSEWKRPLRLVAPIFILLVASNSRATSIIAVTHNGNIWIAADSKETAIGAGDVDSPGRDRYICKLRKQNTFYFAGAGNDYEDPPSGFSIPNLVAASSSPNASIYQTALRFISISKSPIAKETAFIVKYEGARFSLTDSIRFGRVIFFGVERGQPKVWLVTISVHFLDGEWIVDEHAPEPPPKDLPGFGIGVVDTAVDYIMGHQNEVATDPLGVLRKSVAAQVQVDPIHIGGPISIVELSRNGVRWIEPGECTH